MKNKSDIILGVANVNGKNYNLINKEKLENKIIIHAPSIYGKNVSYNYTIKQINIEDYQMLVFSTNSERIDSYLDNVTKNLTSINFKGLVLFDLLLSNGTNKNQRYFQAFFNGEKFDFNSFKNVNVPIEIENLSNLFYAHNLDLINKSILTKPQKFLLKRKLERFIFKNTLAPKIPR